MTRIFKHKRFSQWAKGEGISDLALKTAIQELEGGLFEANLGGGLYKKRVPRPGEGKRGAYRTVVAFRQNERAIFVFGFAKNVRANITSHEREALKRLAHDYFNASVKEWERLIQSRAMIEVR